MTRRLVTGAIVILSALVATPPNARAEPVTLRLATVAPDGTSWARELKAFGREISAATHDNVQVKWYMSAASPATSCSRTRACSAISSTASCRAACSASGWRRRCAPPAWSTSSTIATRRTTSWGASSPSSISEFAKAGYVDVATAGMGFSVLFSRSPIRTMADVRRLRPWLWSLDDVLKTQLGAMGINVVPLPVESSARAYDEGKVDSFVGLPSAALAFQWSAQARYVMDLRVGYLTGCMLLSRRSWDSLSHDDQQTIESAAAKLQVRIQETTRQMDESLLSGLFAKQGLQALVVPASLQAEFAAAAREAQKRVEKLAPAGTVERVSAWIAEYRAAHKR